MFAKTYTSGSKLCVDDYQQNCFFCIYQTNFLHVCLRVICFELTSYPPNGFHNNKIPQEPSTPALSYGKLRGRVDWLHSIPVMRGLNSNNAGWALAQILKFMGPTWGPLSPGGPRWAPCWPHEPCCQERYVTAVARPTISIPCLCNSLEVRTPEDEIYGCLIFKWHALIWHR